VSARPTLGTSAGTATDESEGEAPATRGRSRKYTQVLGLINQAAIEVFASEGLAGASTQAIADKAGCRRRSCTTTSTARKRCTARCCRTS
jgi:TetR/AcrR family transcriptional regulator